MKNKKNHIFSSALKSNLSGDNNKKVFFSGRTKALAFWRINLFDEKKRSCPPPTLLGDWKDTNCRFTFKIIVSLWIYFKTCKQIKDKEDHRRGVLDNKNCPRLPY